MKETKKVWFKATHSKIKNKYAKIMLHDPMTRTGQKERNVYLGLFHVVIKCASVPRLCQV